MLEHDSCLAAKLAPKEPPNATLQPWALRKGAIDREDIAQHVKLLRCSFASVPKESHRNFSTVRLTDS